MFGFLCTVHFIHTYTRIARREIQCPNTVKFNFYFLRRAFGIRHAIRSLLFTVRDSSHVWKGDTPDDCDSNIFACSFSTNKTCSIPPPVKLGKLRPVRNYSFLGSRSQAGEATLRNSLDNLMGTSLDQLTGSTRKKRGQWMPSLRGRRV